MFNLPPLTRRKDIHLKTKFMPLSCLIMLSSVSQVYSVCHGYVHSNLSFTLHSDVHMYNTRRATNIYTNCLATTIYGKNRGITFCNKLPKAVQQCKSPFKFKREINLNT